MRTITGILRTALAPKPGPQRDAVYVETKAPTANSTFGVVKRLISGDSKEYLLPFSSAIPKAASFAVTPSENGATYAISGAGVVAQLPDAVKGLKYKFVILAASNTHALSPSALDAIAAKGLTAVANKDLINSVSAIYDSVEVEAIEDNLWHAVLTGTFTKEA